MKVRNLFLPLFCLISLLSAAQVKKVATLGEHVKSIEGSFRNGGKLFLIARDDKSYNSILTYDTATNKIKKIVSGIYPNFGFTNNTFYYSNLNVSDSNNYVYALDSSAKAQQILQMKKGYFTSRIATFKSKAAFFLSKYKAPWELFVTDGTSSGTVKILETDTDIYQMSMLEFVNDSMLLLSIDKKFSSSNIESWLVLINIYKGTSEYFSKQKFLQPYMAGYSEPILYKNKVYFKYMDSANTMLWVSDGTSAGTYRFFNVTIGNWQGYINPRFKINFDGWLYFQAKDNAITYFYKTDGDTIIKIGPTGFSTAGFMGGDDKESHEFVTYNINNKNHFFNYKLTSDKYGAEFFEIQTPDHSVVKDIRKGAFNGCTVEEVPAEGKTWKGFDGKVYFEADDGMRGMELWSSDGTEAGTGLAADISKGGAWTNIAWMDTLDNQLVVVADRDTALELYTMERQQPIFLLPAVKPTEEWFRTILGNFGSLISKADSKGNFYILFTANGNACFSDTDARIIPGVISSGGDVHMLAKLDKYGRYQWGQVVGEDNTVYDYQMVVDSKGCPAVIGLLSGSRPFNHNDISESVTKSAFIIKFNTDGSLLWKKFYNHKVEKTQLAAIDLHDNMYIMGEYRSFHSNWENLKLDYDHSPANYVVKIDTDGTPQWATTLDKAHINVNEVYDFTVSKSGKQVYALSTYGDGFPILNCITDEGKKLWTKDYLSSVGTLTPLNAGQLAMAGKIGPGKYFDSVPFQSAYPDGYIGFMDSLGTFKMVLSKEYGADVPSALSFNGKNFTLLSKSENNKAEHRKGYESYPYPDGKTRYTVKKLTFTGDVLDSREFYVSDAFFQYMHVSDDGYITLSGKTTGYIDTFAAGITTSSIFLLRFKWDDNYNPTGINPVEAPDKVKVYPNPADNYIDLLFPQETERETKAIFYTIAGQRVLEQTIDKNTQQARLDISGLAAGLYFMVLSDGMSSQTHKVVVVK